MDTEKKNKLPYQKPVLEQVRLITEEVVLAGQSGCKVSDTSPQHQGCNVPDFNSCFKHQN